MIWVSGWSALDLCRTSSQTYGSSLRPLFHVWPASIASEKKSSRDIGPSATSSIRNHNGNRWRGVHRLPRDQKKSVCKNPRSSIRTLFLQVKQLMPHFTMQFWTDCYSESVGFSQSCTDWKMDAAPRKCPCTNCGPCTLIPSSEDGSCASSLPLMPHLAPADYFFFPGLKETIKGERFANVNAIKVLVTPDLRSIPQEDFCWLRPEAVRSLSNVYCSGWRLFWRAMKKICLYLLFCLFPDRMSRCDRLLPEVFIVFRTLPVEVSACATG